MVEKTAAVLFVLSLLAHGLTLEVPQVFYVKPTVPLTTECPSGDSPCHSLQYYANHSNFTNNSRFLFLEGEHHLDSVVTISNVANLSLVGLSSGVEILCKSVPSGFHVEKFMGFNIGNMTITNCTGSEEKQISLLNGSDATLMYVTIDISADGLTATNVLGTFIISSSTFFSSQVGNMLVEYSLCNSRGSYFNFSKNTLQDIEFDIAMHCTDIQVLVDDSRLSTTLRVDYFSLTNNTVSISNSIISGEFFVTMCNGSPCINSILYFLA